MDAVQWAEMRLKFVAQRICERWLWAATALLLLMVICSLPVTAQQEAWATKNIDQWTSADIDTVLNRSAWVMTKVVRLPLRERQAAQSASVDAAQTRQSATAPETAPLVDYVFTLRLRSALPIRLALLRELQLDSGYDGLSKEQRAALNVKLMGLYNCPACANNYVVTLASHARNLSGADAVFDSLNGAKLEDLRRFVYLMNEQGEKRDLIHFMPPQTPGGEATFFFSRFDAQGQPLITPASKEIIFRLADRDNNTTINFVIDVSNITVGGKVIF